jgi:hypothetical protein
MRGWMVFGVSATVKSCGNNGKSETCEGSQIALMFRRETRTPRTIVICLAVRRIPFSLGIERLNMSCKSYGSENQSEFVGRNPRRPETISVQNGSFAISWDGTVLATVHFDRLLGWHGACKVIPSI